MWATSNMFSVHIQNLGGLRAKKFNSYSEHVRSLLRGQKDSKEFEAFLLCNASIDYIHSVVITYDDQS